MIKPSPTFGHSSSPISHQLSATISNFASGLKPFQKARGSQHKPRQQGLSNAEAKRSSLPVRSEQAERDARDKLEAKGLFLARQDRWDDLGDLIRDTDQTRAMTPGGMAKSECLALGARVDVVMPLRAALSDPGLLPQHAPRHGLTHLEMLLEEYPDDYGVALVVINANIDAAWAWRDAKSTRGDTIKNMQNFQALMARAEEILDRFNPFECNSPALAKARCAVLAAHQNPQRRLADDFEDLIDLDPENPQHMRAFGCHLLPSRYGGYQSLEVEARRIASLTQDIWGDGGYAFVYLDAIAQDPGTLDLLDVAFFSGCALRYHPALRRSADPQHAGRLLLRHPGPGALWHRPASGHHSRVARRF